MDHNLDFEADDIESVKKVKKRNGCTKGKRFEREIVKILTARFGEGFSRSIGSGNRWGQVANLPEHAKLTLTGDICCPEGFLWVFECKGGYADVDVHSFFKGNKKFDEFLKQAEDDGKRLNKLPAVIWKKDRKEIIAAFKNDDLFVDFKYSFNYRNWVIVSLDDFLALDDRCFTQSR
jgi:hypothetical protein